jgi:hypothetical protein
MLSHEAFLLHLFRLNRLTPLSEETNNPIPLLRQRCLCLPTIWARNLQPTVL